MSSFSPPYQCLQENFSETPPWCLSFTMSALIHCPWRVFFQAKLGLCTMYNVHNYWFSLQKACCTFSFHSQKHYSFLHLSFKYPRVGPKRKTSGERLHRTVVFFHLVLFIGFKKFVWKPLKDSNHRSIELSIQPNWSLKNPEFINIFCYQKPYSKFSYGISLEWKMLI